MGSLDEGDKNDKSKCFMEIENLLKKDVAMTQRQLHTVVELLNQNLLRRESPEPILKIFRSILLKCQSGSYVEFPLYDEVMRAVLMSLANVMKKNDWSSAVVKNINFAALKFLSDFPVDLIHKANKKIAKPMLDVLECYLNTADDRLPNHNKLTFLYQTLLNSYTEAERIEFVESGLNVWLGALMNFIFKKENPDRDFGMLILDDILPQLLEINYFSNPHWPILYEKFLNASKFPAFLVERLKKGDQLWHRLWILIIKLSGTELHKIGASINPLLFVVQEGFKSNIDAKCQAFECLRSLIDNFALNDSVLFNPSRIKVLSIALESNNAKTLQVSLKKFSVWWHLIKLLQPKIKLFNINILLPFLKFCFSDPKKNIQPANRLYPGETFPEIQTLAIKAFVEICGHVNCDGCTGDEFADFPSSILDPQLLEQSYANWIYSLKQTTHYTWQHLQKSNESEAEMLFNNLSCVWKSFIKTAAAITNKEAFSCIFEHLLKLLILFVEEYSSDPLFSELILKVLIPAIVDKDTGFPYSTMSELDNKIFNGESPIRSIIKLSMLSKLYHKTSMSKIPYDFTYITNVVLSSGSKEFLIWFVHKIRPENHGVLIWCNLIDAILNSTTPIITTALSSVYLWPINYCKTNSDLSTIAEAWDRLLYIQKTHIRTVKNKSIQQMDEDVIVGLEKCVNPVVTINLMPLLIKKRTEDKLDDIAAINRHLTCYNNSLNKLNIDNSNVPQTAALCGGLQTFATLLGNCYSYNITLPATELLIKTINNNLECLIINLNDHIQDFIKCVPNSTEFINSFLETLSQLNVPSYADSFTSKISVLLELFSTNVTDVDIDVKYKNMLKAQVFDKSKLIEIQNMIRIKKKLKNEAVEVQKNKFEPPPVKVSRKSKNDDEFVVIKPTWKFDPKNLTEHQKDALKRRREDIPALYEDLSQSQDEQSIAAWRPPGYKSDSQGDSSISQEVVQLKFLNKTAVTNSDKIKSPFASLKKKVDISTGETPRIMKESNNIVTPVSKDKDSPKVSSDAKKTNLENVETPPQSGKKRKSLLSRLNESIKSIKASDNDLTPEKPKPAEKSTEDDGSDQTDKGTPKSAIRPIRIKRKPTKFLSEEEFTATKQVGSSVKSDQSGSDSSSQESVDGVKPLPVTPKSLKKNRLMSQLSIDTIEGHPLINSSNISKSGSRNTRRSTIKPAEKSTEKPVEDVKSIHSMETECFNESMVLDADKSIFSQETQNKCEDKKEDLTPSPEIDEMDLNKCNQSQSLECSPYFIASSQEDNDSTSLMLVMSKSKDSSAVESKVDKTEEVELERESQMPTQPMDTELIETEDVEMVENKPSEPELNTEPEDNIFDTTHISNNSFANISIVSSPCSDTINERNQEFLNNTIDLSPIKHVTPFESSIVISPVKNPDENLEIQSAASPDLFSNEKTSPVKRTDKEEENSPPKTNVNTVFNVKPKTGFPSHVFGNRAAQMISLCMGLNDGDVDAIDVDKPSSPGSVDQNKTEDDSKLNMFEFNKTVPASSACPIGPILKRKLEADSFTSSPLSKKKRVSFHDPPISIELMVDNYIERTPIPRSPQVTKMLARNIARSNKLNRLAPKSLLDRMDSKETDVAEMDVSETSVTESELSELCSLPLNPVDRFEIVDNCALDDLNPIYPKLIECTVSIAEIAKDLSSPGWKTEFMTATEDKLKTIGDLAKLTELEVNRLPIKYPRIDTVKRVLANYEETINQLGGFNEIKVTESFFDVTFNDKPEIVEVEAIPQPVDIIELNSEDIAATEVVETTVNSPVEPTFEDRVKSLNCLLETHPETVVKNTVDRLPNSDVLDAISTSNLLEYVLNKMSMDNSFYDSIKTKCEEVEGANMNADARKRCEDMVKSYKDQMRATCARVMRELETEDVG